METSQFFDWFKHSFIEHVKDQTGNKLLILDGHKSHITLEIVNLAKENHIAIICLPPHSTHILQLLDVAVFKPIKGEWRNIIQRHNQGFNNIDKNNFSRLLRLLTESNNVFLRRHAVAGFETCGIYPVNRNAITNEKIKLNSTFINTIQRKTADNDSSEESDDDELNGREEEIVVEDDVEEEDVDMIASNISAEIISDSSDNDCTLPKASTS